MPNQRHQQNRPIGDTDLTGGRPTNDEMIVSGGVGPSGSSFSSTGKLGGLGNTSDGAERRTDSDSSADDHAVDPDYIIDTNRTGGE